MTDPKYPMPPAPPPMAAPPAPGPAPGAPQAPAMPAPPPMAAPQAPAMPPAAPPMAAPAMPPPQAPAMPPPQAPAMPAAPTAPPVAAPAVPSTPAPPAATPPGVPPTTPGVVAGAATSAPVDNQYAAAIAAQDAALDRTMPRRKGDFEKADWFKAKPPAQIGSSADYYVLILDPATPTVHGLPWCLTFQHRGMRQGQFTARICPKKDAEVNNMPETPCLLCDAAEARFAEMRRFPKEDPTGDYWKKQGMKLRADARVFMCVFDLNNPQRHVHQEEDGSMKIKPAVWACSLTLMRALQQKLQYGPFQLNGGYSAIKITATRKGKADRDVTYDVDLDPRYLHQYRIPDGYEAILQNPYDLNQLRNHPDTTELKLLLPNDALTAATTQMPQATPAQHAAPVPAMAAPMPTQPVMVPPAQPQYAAPPQMGYAPPQSAPPQPQMAPPSVGHPPVPPPAGVPQAGAPQGMPPVPPGPPPVQPPVAAPGVPSPPGMPVPPTIPGTGQA